jgi:ATP-dependent RNA helicase DHX36
VTAEESLLEAYQQGVDDDDIDFELLIVLLEALMRKLDTALLSGNGAILVFLPGWEEISKSMELCRSNPVLGNSRRAVLLALHSAIPTSEQRKVFQHAAPGVAKIIFSTNVAETSITIDDVVFVVDCGKVKEKSYDAYTGCSSLSSVWTSQASTRQRAGRAGRVRAGEAYHLFSKKRHAAMEEFTLPEMLRTPLEELCLQIKFMEVHADVIAAGRTGGASLEEVDEVTRFLAKAVQPPEKSSIQRAIETLHDIGALRSNTRGTSNKFQLSGLGWRLAQLPMSPRLGKMLLFAAVFGCLDPVLTIACAMSYRPPYVLPMHPSEKFYANQAKQELSRDTKSDHLTLLFAYDGFMQARKRGGGAPGKE